MNYNLRGPCVKCPFRFDIDGYLREERVYEITDALWAGYEFPCHCTTEVDEENESECVATEASEHCAGAMIFLVKHGRRFSDYDLRRLDMSAPVFDDADDMALHHAEATRR